MTNSILSEKWDFSNKVYLKKWEGQPIFKKSYGQGEDQEESAGRRVFLPLGTLVALLLLALLGVFYLYVQERAVLGVVRDEQTGQPISGAEVVMGEKRQATDGEGRFRFPRLGENTPSLSGQKDIWPPRGMWRSRGSSPGSFRWR
jgi:hypothetical protein